MVDESEIGHLVCNDCGRHSYFTLALLATGAVTRCPHCHGHLVFAPEIPTPSIKMLLFPKGQLSTSLGPPDID